MMRSLAKSNRKVPLRIIVMGKSIKLSYSATVEEFKKIMLDKFGFAEDPKIAQSTILVEFFEDHFKEERQRSRA